MINTVVVVIFYNDNKTEVHCQLPMQQGILFAWVQSSLAHFLKTNARNCNFLWLLVPWSVFFPPLTSCLCCLQSVRMISGDCSTAAWPMDPAVVIMSASLHDTGHKSFNNSTSYLILFCNPHFQTLLLSLVIFAEVSQLKYNGSYFYQTVH